MTGEHGFDADRCEVCRWPRSAENRCATCGWDSGRDDTRLRGAARHRWDLLAARRALGVGFLAGGEHHDLLRAGPPDDHEPERAGAEVGDAGAAVAQRPGLVVAAPGSTVALLGLGPDGIDIVEMVPDEGGLFAAGDRQQWPWAKLLTSVDCDATQLRFHVAGGIGPGDVDPVALAREVWTNLPMTSLAGRSMLFVLPEPDWALTVWTVQLYCRNRSATVWRGVGVEETVRRLSRTRPLDRPYHLVLADADADGVSRLVPVLAFPSGTVPPAVAVVPVAVPPGIRGPLALPVMLCQDSHGEGQRDVREWLPVRIGSAELPAGGTDMVTMRLSSSGTLSIDRFGDEHRGWPELLAAVGAGSPRTDLVLAIDISGAEAAERLVLGRAVLGELTDASSGSQPAPGSLRVVLVGYGQHDVRHPRDAEVPLVEKAFDSAADAQMELGFWKALPNRDDVAAGVEHALVAVSKVIWRPTARRVAVFVGGKPPYPVAQDPFDPALPCPQRLDWRDYADQLRNDGVSIVVVQKPPGWRHRGRIRSAIERRADAWRELGVQGRYGYDVPPSSLARAIALLGSPSVPDLPPFARPCPSMPSTLTEGGDDAL
ncbi:hypothetical protein FJK98_25210 [Micromonospora sp. HM134]|uniref:hypothetical protein n=1 Tax=unclassified Micromonospora TaxID=2617518 RepID=UPI001198406F|nr:MULTISPECIES: hypothetical protein [unclassified Micromonospora]QDY10045.1 hypothetical protein FJK98_25210 [Micromonospora sp. HM134]